jgi:hypothetical protein
MGAFVKNVETRLQTEKFNVQQLSNLLWALSISQVSFRARLCRAALTCSQVNTLNLRPLVHNNRVRDKIG